MCGCKYNIKLMLEMVIMFRLRMVIMFRLRMPRGILSSLYIL